MNGMGMLSSCIEPANRQQIEVRALKIRVGALKIYIACSTKPSTQRWLLGFRHRFTGLERAGMVRGRT